MICRIFFFLTPHYLDNAPLLCFYGYMNLLPIAFGFAAFSLLLTSFAWIFSGKSWDDYITFIPNKKSFASLFKRRKSKAINPSFKPLTPKSSTYINHVQITKAENNYNTENISRRNSSGEPVYYTRSYQHDDFISNEISSPIESLGDSNNSTKRSILNIKKKYVWLITFIIINFLWTSFIISFATLSCSAMFIPLIQDCKY